MSRLFRSCTVIVLGFCVTAYLLYRAMFWDWGDYDPTFHSMQVILLIAAGMAVVGTGALTGRVWGAPSWVGGGCGVVFLMLFYAWLAEMGNR